MRYSLKTIQAILEANGYSVGFPVEIAPTTASLAYYYSPAPLTLERLLQDTVEFVQHYSVTTRRVCFLLPAATDPANPDAAYSAVIVLCSAPQDLSVSALNELKSKTANMGDDTTLSLCHALYRHVHVWFVGQIAQEVYESPHHPFFSLFQTAYGPQVHFQLQPIDPAPHANLVLTECLLRILSGESLQTIDAKQAYTRHRDVCAQAVLSQLNALQRNQPEAYETLTTHLRVLSKYIALRSMRPKVPLTQLTSTERLALQKRYPMYKQAVYSGITDLTRLIQALSLEPLVELLQAKTHEQRAYYLQQERQAQLQELKQWEQPLFQSSSWTAQAVQLGQHSWHHLYQYSFIGLGAELTPWFGKQVAGWFTAAPQGQLFANTLTQWVSPTTLLKGCQWLGGGLGAWGTYAVGGYWLGKSCLTGVIAKGFNAYYGQIQMDDENAQIHLPKRYLSDPLTQVRSAGFLLACLETLYTGTLQPMIHTLGGWVGSVSFVTLAKRWIKDLHSAGASQITDNQAVALLFLGLAGYDVGRLLADYGYHGVDKQFARARLNEIFCQLTEEKNFTGCVTDFTEQPTWSPSFWLNTRDPVQIGWTVNGTFHEADCEVIKLANEERAVLCETPTSRLLLPLR